MEKQVDLEMDGRTAEEVEELNLDSCKATQIAGITEKFVNLQTLSLANNELSSLKGLPKLPSLRKLDLSDNKISDSLDVLVGSPDLEYISLSGNPIKDLSCLEPLKKLKALQTLETFNCEIAQSEDYRDKIFELLPDLLFVDGFDRDGEPAPDEDEDYDEDDEDGEDGVTDEEDSEDGVDEDGFDDEDDDDDDDDGDDADDDEEDTEGRGTKRTHDEISNDADAS